MYIKNEDLCIILLENALAKRTCVSFSMISICHKNQHFHGKNHDFKGGNHHFKGKNPQIIHANARSSQSCR